MARATVPLGLHLQRKTLCVEDRLSSLWPCSSDTSLSRGGGIPQSECRLVVGWSYDRHLGGDVALRSPKRPTHAVESGKRDSFQACAYDLPPP